MSRKRAALLCIISLSPSKVKQSAPSCVCVEECCVLLQLVNRLHFKAPHTVTENHMLCFVGVREAIIKALILERRTVTPILICHLRNSAGIIWIDLGRGYFPSVSSSRNMIRRSLWGWVTDHLHAGGAAEHPPCGENEKNTPPHALFNQPRSQTPVQKILFYFTKLTTWIRLTCFGGFSSFDLTPQRAN